MLRVGVAGASGYVGGELLRILTAHPHVTVTAIASDQTAGKPIQAVFPHLAGRLALTLEPFDPERLARKADFVFLALPHTTAMRAVSACRTLGLRVIDLSADFRLKDPMVYERWYRTAHLYPELLSHAVYGIPEFYRTEIRDAALVAVPGCYPTAAILQLAPLVQRAFIHHDLIVIDAKSGISGAGRKAVLPLHFPEAHDGLEAYSLGHHRHIPEIEQELNAIARRDAPSSQPDVVVSFTPHRVPMNRGILSTASVRLRTPMTGDELRAVYQEFYKTEPFVRLVDPGEWPNPRNLRGSNRCDLAVHVDPRTGWTTTLAALDNLVKGAGGQAVQAMNLMAGFPESCGLDIAGSFP